MRNWIRVRVKVKSRIWIRIRIEVERGNRIRNTAIDFITTSVRIKCSLKYMYFMEAEQRRLPRLSESARTQTV